MRIALFSRIILRISPYSVRMRENTDQNNSEYGGFLRSDSDRFSCYDLMLKNAKYCDWYSWQLRKLRHILYRIFGTFYFDCTSSFKRFSNIFWTAWPKKLKDAILDRKFKTPYVKIRKFDNFRKIKALGSSFPKFP